MRKARDYLKAIIGHRVGMNDVDPYATIKCWMRAVHPPSKTESESVAERMFGFLLMTIGKAASGYKDVRMRK